jgi:hypothetical protein
MRRCCFLGTTCACTFRLCSISSLVTPGISAGFHTNMSRLARRKLTSVISYFSPKPAPMTTVLDESPSWSWIVLRATLPVDWMLDLLAFLVGISSPAWESCCVVASTSPEASVKRPPIREDLKVLIYQSQEADNTFITSDGTSPYNSTW